MAGFVRVVGVRRLEVPQAEHDLRVGEVDDIWIVRELVREMKKRSYSDSATALEVHRTSVIVLTLSADAGLQKIFVRPRRR